MSKNKSFFERLTGSIRLEDDEEEFNMPTSLGNSSNKGLKLSNSENNKDSLANKKESSWEQEQEAELTMDMYQTATEIVIQTMVAGVLPENLSIAITRDMVTIRGKREENRSITEDNYFSRELYWGSFSRTVSLPEEINPEEAEAVEKHGLLIIKLPKINKNKETMLRIRSI